MENLTLDRIERELASMNGCEEIRAYRDRLHEALQGPLLLADPLEWNDTVNRVHDLIIRRIVELSERRLLEDGMAAPPLRYAFLLFGSGGRAEQTLWSDQDNGLVYEEPGSEEERKYAADYYAKLAKRISRNLTAAGYPPCSGEVVCSNDRWRKTVNEYREMLRKWLEEPSWEKVRYVLIAADLRTVYGDARLGEAVSDVIFDYVRRHPAMLERMLHNTLHHKVSLGVFGQLIRERYGEEAGGVEVKYGAYIPIVNGIRLLAIDAGIRATSTRRRIEGLIGTSFVDEEIGGDWLEALSIALKLRSMTPFQLDDGQFSTRGKLTADQLTKERVKELKFCLRIGMDLQKYVKKHVQKEMD